MFPNTWVLEQRDYKICWNWSNPWLFNARLGLSIIDSIKEETKVHKFFTVSPNFRMQHNFTVTFHGLVSECCSAPQALCISLYPKSDEERPLVWKTKKSHCLTIILRGWTEFTIFNIIALLITLTFVFLLLWRYINF